MKIENNFKEELVLGLKTDLKTLFGLELAQLGNI